MILIAYRDGLRVSELVTMRWDMLDEKTLREAIRNHPLVTDKDAWRKERPFRVAVVEQ